MELPLTFLIDNGNDPSTAAYKTGMISDISTMIIDEVKAQGITKATCNNLDTHAYSIADFISDPCLRNMHIMEYGE